MLREPGLSCLSSAMVTLVTSLTNISATCQAISSFIFSWSSSLLTNFLTALLILDVFLVPSFLFMCGARSQPGSYRPSELIFPILSLTLFLRHNLSGSEVSLSMLKLLSGEVVVEALAMARRVLLVLGLLTSLPSLAWRLTSLLQSLLWSSLRTLLALVVAVIRPGLR